MPKASIRKFVGHSNEDSGRADGNLPPVFSVANTPAAIGRPPHQSTGAVTQSPLT